ncbi:LpqN/LpqT family lipoprotein [Mycolicibacterium sp. 050232]|uniref:LpqN/LpqT family lipoprotein n=1 Tax=Mycolicibacterium sp. 050232 TaxID=3113982 RepID=UPI002E2B294C|nr:LpqN/LpqT family lipoprotein [Mycolicibacterium sp. 050232]MED5813733.1 LpqN/LpqT family lipoprotein [Mycolicibacterium sp. 050232]
MNDHFAGLAGRSVLSGLAYALSAMGDMKRVAGVVVLAAGLLVSGCATTVDGTATAGFEPHAHSAGSSDPNAPGSGYKAQPCEQLHSDAWIELPGAPDEPRVRVAQPPGWQPVPELATGTVKLVLRNPSLSDGVTNPALSVSTADATHGDLPPQDLLNETVKGFQAAGGQNITQVPSEICGFPALMVNYTVPTPDGGKTAYVTAVTVMVPLGSRVWNVVALAQSTAPNNKTYMADAQVMLAGLRIAMPR